METLTHRPQRRQALECEPEWLRISGVTLAVRELDRVAAFYRDVIGLEVLAREDGAVRMGVDGGAFLELLHRPAAKPDDPASAGLFHTAFLLPSRADLGRWLTHFRTLGQPLDGGADHLVSEAAYLRDPEGNGVEVYVDQPREQWVWRDGPDGRRVEMANRPLDIEGLLRLADAPWAGAPAGTRIGHVHLRVGDIGEARRFYGGLLGMDVTAGWDASAFLSSGGYHHHVAANTWRSAGAGPRDPARAGLASVTLDVADEQALAGIVGRVGEGGGEGGLQNRSLVDRSLVDRSLVDPWGTIVRLRLAEPNRQPTSHRTQS